MHRIANVFKIQFFPVENIFFPINGISHSLYVKFKM